VRKSKEGRGEGFGCLKRTPLGRPIDSEGGQRLNGCKGGKVPEAGEERRKVRRGRRFLTRQADVPLVRREPRKSSIARTTARGRKRREACWGAAPKEKVIV